MTALHPFRCTFRLPFSSYSSSSSLGSRRLRCSGDNQAPAALDTNKLLSRISIDSSAHLRGSSPIGYPSRSSIFRIWVPFSYQTYAKLRATYIVGLVLVGANKHGFLLPDFLLVLEVKEKLQREHANLPIGKNGRDDEEMLLWFLKDRRFSVEEAAMKLSMAIKWREDFGVSNLCQESVQELYATGKAYVHDFPDNKGRPVFVVVARKHFPGVVLFLMHHIICEQKQEFIEDERLCVHMIENALSKLPPGVEQILGIIDLRGFRIENTDIKFLKFLVLSASYHYKLCLGYNICNKIDVFTRYLFRQIDVFYYYYPKRLGQVLFVNAPLVFRPVWQLMKPLLKSYASLARFCDMETVRKEYFTESTVPPDFLD
ncbi:hypothetical protein ZIOFF_030637 [Zingiber officinale]|uniref:CRAL-TRIO domain-containing protein n=1 Tax=Zingiber officinale TaxID=94328 RepID=A0A8J5LBP2_ZINOF|nr:hypothetical protein ZIOFF_030637 [Zingiber officinale]